MKASSSNIRSFFLIQKQYIMENNKKLTRASAGNRMVAGVCAGIADYFGWDPTLLRIVYVLATIFTAFAGIIIYIILWIVMPERRPGDEIGRASCRERV